MGRKKRNMSCLQPFCYYCEKTFRNQVFLHQHQKFKHFICLRCNKKFSSLDSMLGHYKTTQNHDIIEKVPNAIRGRENIGLKIFGMQGVPRVEVESWIMKGAESYWGKIVDENNKKLAKQLKQKQIMEDEQDAEEDQKEGLQRIEEEKEEEVPTGPISFQLQK